MNDKELEKIEKIIESCHLNFMIGSGASRNFLDTLSNVEELLTKLDTETENTVLESSIKYEYFDKCIRGNIKLFDDIKLVSEKEEEFINTKETYYNFIKALNIILLKRRTNLLNRQVNLFTTNMDMFLDKTLDETTVEFNDGFSGKFEPVFSTSNYQKSFFKSSAQYDIKSELPLFNLFKLHGSITWKQSEVNNNETKIIYDSTLQTLRKLDKISFNVDEEIISNIKDFEQAKKKVIELDVKNLDNHFKFLKEYKDLVMINPNKEKFESTTLRLEYYEQLRMYSNALEKENSVLFVCGFSFADEHIREITLRVANSNPTLIIYVFCRTNKGKMDIEKKLKESKFNNINYFVIGDFSEAVNKVFTKIATKLDYKSYNIDKEKSEPLVNEKQSIADEEAK
jgi:hypothetical protein